MVKEQTGIATCLLNRAHKTRDERSKSVILRRCAHDEVWSLQPLLIQVTLVATM